MAKYLAQLILAGSQVVGRAFARAIKQEIEASQQAAQRLGNAKTRGERIANQKVGLSLDEAKQILNVSKLSKEEVEESYNRLFKLNEKPSGSFYLQSKVVRAKERIDMELRAAEQQQKTETAKAEESNKT
ncbi:mitochondrial import inner membrane translocase subunit TIM16-like [Aethina tumida]|uniref:mitochondrial import inner membrane translocase subunit TIM16-like n=1 Tax=Aethina tumida TaxID=116153 RepID=UPI00096B2502|nr:mitochondrial import inner membrane translocase subunit TIM16-like [Aethina tumida]